MDGSRSLRRRERRRRERGVEKEKKIGYEIDMRFGRKRKILYTRKRKRGMKYIRWHLEEVKTLTWPIRK